MMENTTLREILRQFIAAEDYDAIEAAKDAARVALGEASESAWCGRTEEVQMSFNTELATKVRDKVTGYEGVATARSEFLDGARRVMIERVTADGKHEETWFDDARLETIE
jgi:hypothetical protein